MSFRDLFAWEWRRTGRSPLLWVVPAILTASFVWGASNTAELHQSQRAAQIQTLRAEQAHLLSLRERAKAYRAPVTPNAPEVPYWQDPTNVSGFSQYFVFVHAAKPHLPLSALAAGSSDLVPSRLEVKLNTPFGFQDSYDFENPRGLALGRFDLGFALVYLLPIGLILLFGLMTTVERDRGMLRLVAAQTTRSHQWLGARFAAILAWALPAVLAGVAAALAVAGAPLASAAPELLAALFLVGAYVVFWTGLSAVVLAGFPSAAGGVGALTAIWAALTIGLPLLGTALAARLDPAPSPITYVDAQRRVADAIETEADTLLRKAFLARPSLRDATDQVAKIDHATRLSFLVPETERRLGPLLSDAQAHLDRQNQVAALTAFLVPSLGMEAGLTALAGTDASRHRQFERQARDYQLRLRDFLYPLVQREITAPAQAPSAPTRGKLNFTDFDALPRFAFVEASAASRLGVVAGMSGWLIALGAGLAAFGLRRARSWPKDL